MVRVAGFGEFVNVLTRPSNDRQVMRALAERWWDTTNSFHFSFGEMMVMPLDFAAITDLRVGGDPIPYDAAAGRDPEIQRRLLGYWLRAEKRDAPYTQLLEFWMEPQGGRVQEEQIARCFLLYVLDASLFPNRRNRVHLSFLLALRNIGEIARFDWGGAALGACYAFMGSLSRGAGKSLRSYW
ncbi:protein MAINTENANCE OF MERISTEMS-like [Rhododendron vialii]|uniref:protein MAINTENANCE OF MERISTEMS-like n=1 Tax=Rhododendron vialii TaxID=182163 RepID=UPI00265EE326|nr:protein MAINTENANCE OF MERISTEMS-like [Rhododendron vialii]